MGRREENKRRKLEALRQAGTEAFAEHGYAATSIEMVVKRAGVARGTFYLYFPDKLALFAALLDPFFCAIEASIQHVDIALASPTPPPLPELYAAMAMQIAQVGITHATAIELAFREQRSSSEAGGWIRSREDALLAAAVQITRAAADRDLIVADRPDVVTRAILGAIERLIFDVLAGEDLGPPLDVAAEVVALFTRALVPAQDPQVPRA